MPQIHRLKSKYKFPRLFALLTFISEANNLWNFYCQNAKFLICESVAIFFNLLTCIVANVLIPGIVFELVQKRIK
jgi:hypothetical protein